MLVCYERCCGVDVHKKQITVCVITPEKKQTQTFGTMTGELVALKDWLLAEGVTHLAMESTGVYWKPLYNVLEETTIDVKLVNAHSIKALPGRKTDVKDAEWIADLLQHGLLQGSYVPDREQRELRELVRYRRALINERADEINRVQKVLEGANIKLSSVATDVMGKSGRAMIEAMINGIEDPETLASMAKGRLQKKRKDLEKALHGLIGNHQRMVLAAQLRHIDFLDEEIKRLDKEIDDRMGPYQEAIERLDPIPGIGQRTAQEILTYIGIDMSRFASAQHLASWAKVCPGSNESAGKRKSSSTGKGIPVLRSALVEAAWAATHTKDTYLASFYRRLAARRGSKRALLAVAHRILVIIYHVLQDNVDYIERGAGYVNSKQRNAAVHRSINYPAAELRGM